jgi:hypothetical protein
MLALKADYSRLVWIKKLVVAIKMAMDMNCALKIVALPARFALNKNIAICY